MINRNACFVSSSEAFRDGGSLRLFLFHKAAPKEKREDVYRKERKGRRGFSY
jgi:hypothetical protein